MKKQEKAITLVALIITIIILLILAVVSIRAITGNGLFTKATDGVDKYDNSQEKENLLLGSYEDLLDTYLNLKLNNYGFYYNVYYICDDYFTGYNGSVKVKFFEDKTVEMLVTQEGLTSLIGENGSIRDFANQPSPTFNIEPNTPYEYTASLNSHCKFSVTSDGLLTATFIVPADQITYSDKKVSAGGVVEGIFSEDGKSYTSNGKTYIMQ